MSGLTLKETLKTLYLETKPLHNSQGGRYQSAVHSGADTFGHDRRQGTKISEGSMYQIHRVTRRPLGELDSFHF